MLATESREQKMLRQRQLALKRQRDMAAANFGVMAQEHAPTMAKKGTNWAQFLVEVDRPNSRTDRAPSAQGVVKVVVGRPGSVESEQAEAFDSQILPANVQDQRGETPFSVYQSLGDTIPIDCVQLDCGADARQVERPEQPVGREQGWDLQLQSDAAWQDKEDPQRRRFWRGWGAKKSAHFGGEDAADEAVAAFNSDDAEGEEEQSIGGAPTASRAQTPWPALDAAAGLTDDAVLPGAMDEDCRPLAQTACVEID
mmetsp:Transcript_28076/g.71040  ORF Transcript_28076/g.71040 Transcript_28076/m.71040 type:complete len:255 (-) Transcript_28076:122-886(-)